VDIARIKMFHWTGSFIRIHCHIYLLSNGNVFLPYTHYSLLQIKIGQFKSPRTHGLARSCMKQAKEFVE